MKFAFLGTALASIFLSNHGTEAVNEKYLKLEDEINQLESDIAILSKTWRPTNLPTNPPTNPPMNLPTNPPTNPPINLPTNPPTNLPINLPTNPPTNPPPSCRKKKSTPVKADENGWVFKSNYSFGPIFHINKVLSNPKEPWGEFKFASTAIPIMLIDYENPVWTNWYSKGSNEAPECPDQMFVLQIACVGSNCEMMRLMCVSFAGNDFKLSTEVEGEKKTGFVTDVGNCGDEYALVGLSRSGPNMEKFNMKCRHWEGIC